MRVVTWVSMLASAMPMLAGPASADDKDVIEYREHAMKTLNEQAEALGQIVSTAIPDENAAAHLEIIAMTASTALKAFELKVPGGESKAAVWSNWPDFSRRMTDFAARTAEAARLAKEKGAKAGLGDIDSTLTCKKCHEIYREEKKK